MTPKTVRTARVRAALSRRARWLNSWVGADETVRDDSVATSPASLLTGKGAGWIRLGLAVMGGADMGIEPPDVSVRPRVDR
jgi:hypothetical protein